MPTPPLNTINLYYRDRNSNNLITVKATSNDGVSWNTSLPNYVTTLEQFLVVFNNGGIPDGVDITDCP